MPEAEPIIIVPPEDNVNVPAPLIVLVPRFNVPPLLTVTEPALPTARLLVSATPAELVLVIVIAPVGDVGKPVPVLCATLPL